MVQAQSRRGMAPLHPGRPRLLSGNLSQDLHGADPIQVTHGATANLLVQGVQATNDVDEVSKGTGEAKKEI